MGLIGRSGVTWAGEPGVERDLLIRKRPIMAGINTNGKLWRGDRGVGGEVFNKFAGWRWVRC